MTPTPIAERLAETVTTSFSSGAVTTCFYALGQSQVGFDFKSFRLWYKRSNRLRNHRGSMQTLIGLA